jgi:ABC-2 type transport system ATP-binding protein
MKYAVETFSLTKVFTDLWGRQKVKAVTDLNLKIKENEIFGLLGPNGSGKTTTIKMLLGLLYPTKGKALVLGGDANEPKISTRIGFLPEESYLYRYLTARETLDFYGRLFSLPSKVRKSRIDALLEMVGLQAVANRQVGTFSKGMTRRIGLAQALINDPDLLILDEPTTGLDPIGTRQIKDLILKLSERGKTVLLSSHLLADVEDVCDRIAILYGGEIQTLGEVKDLLKQTDKQQITASKLSDEGIAELKTFFDKQGVEYSIDSPMEKLETFFVESVTAAQQKKVTTSGAVSTTNIGDFLSDSSKSEDVLSKLTEPSPESPEPQPETEKIEEPSTESVEDACDKDVLEDLTKEQFSEGQEERDVETEAVEPKATDTEDMQKKRKNVLDELTGGSENKKPDKSESGEDDA